MKVPLPRSLVRFAMSPLVSGLCRTWRYSTHGAARVARARAAPAPFIFMLWHEAIFPLLWWHRGEGIAIVVSQGREGRYIGDYATRLGYRLLPGSSSRGGPRALLGAVRSLEEGHTVAITPDGPRGPRRVLKPGVLQAAQRTGALIVPLHAVAVSAWHARSWDRLAVPRPFARITVGYGEPFNVEPGTPGIEQGMDVASRAMADLEAEMNQS
ncbi:MAG TPA: lysophospholipid acyltransferase family protein [Gemmatimonadales bacterium]|nr:lysophospholipid acyltransferase family protein [Gemmatimonadales bacterium]